MSQLAGRYYIDGIDLWTAFSIVVENGSADFLRFAPRKASIEHDWLDSNGIEVDVSKIFFKERTGTLNMAIFADSEDDFWTKYNLFISNLTQPGLRRLTIDAHGEKSYYVVYQETISWRQIQSLKGKDTPYKIAQRFSIVIMEPEPTVDQGHIFIIDEDGRYLIT